YKRPLILMTPDDLTQLYDLQPNWVYATRGIPNYYYIRTASVFGLHPCPLANINSELFIVYRGLPPWAVNAGDKLYIPQGGDSALIAYACWRGSLKDATGEGKSRVDSFRALWDEQLAKCKRQVEALGDDDVTVYGEWGQTRSRRQAPRNDWEDGTPIVYP